MRGTRDPARPGVEETTADGSRARTDHIPVWRMGVAGGLVGIVCCVGPTALALFGVVGAGTAFVWANTLYDGYAWWFRFAGLATMLLLVSVALHRRGQCSLRGVVALRGRLLVMLGVAVGTYVALYGLTTLLGRLAR
jgi:hypothetical protein